MSKRNIQTSDLPSLVQNAAKASVNVVNYGADPTGNADSTTAFQNAINAATPTSYGGPAGMVFVPAGNYLIKSIVLGQRVHLMGAGVGSTQLIMNSTTANAVMITNTQNANGSGKPANMCAVSNLMLNGYQQQASWQSGIVFNNAVSGYEYQDARHQISNVHVEQFSGDGIVQYGYGVSQIVSCQVYDCSGFGIIVEADCEITNCDVGTSGIDGFYLNGNSTITNCKAWYSGGALTSTRGNSGATALSVTAPGNAWDPTGPYTMANGFGNGFTDGSNSGCTITGCEAQDNSRAGFYCGFLTVLSGCVADSNNNNGIVSGTTGLGSYAGFDFNAREFEAVGCLSWDRGANSNHQAAAVNLSNEYTQGRIRMQFRGELNNGSNMPPLTAGSFSSTKFCDIEFASGGSSYGAVSYNISGTQNFDPYQATTNDFTLGGAMTVTMEYAGIDNNNNPSDSTTGLFIYPGLRMRFMIRQNSTGGYAITWPLNTKIASTIPTTANSVTFLELVYDGTNWRQTGFAAMSS